MLIEIEHRDVMLTNNKFTWLDDHVIEQWTKAHVEVISFHIHRSKVHLALSARWSYNEFESSRRSDQLLLLWKSVENTTLNQIQSLNFRDAAKRYDVSLMTIHRVNLHNELLRLALNEKDAASLRQIRWKVTMRWRSCSSERFKTRLLWWIQQIRLTSVISFDIVVKSTTFNAVTNVTTDAFQ